MLSSPHHGIVLCRSGDLEMNATESNLFKQRPCVKYIPCYLGITRYE
jgi:hypothetical protein